MKHNGRKCLVLHTYFKDKEAYAEAMMEVRLLTKNFSRAVGLEKNELIISY